MSVLVVIPTYNEADTIGTTVAGVLAADCGADVLVVDDASPDGTADVVRALGQDGRVQLLDRPGKAGLGRAYIAGFRRALADGRYAVVAQMDADGSHDPADLDRLVDALDDADLAVGSRYVPGGGVIGWPAHRVALSRAGNAYARLWVRSPVRDLTGGFKAWRAATLAGVELDSIRSDGYAFQVETTARAAARGARVSEVPIRFRNRVHGTSKMTGAIAFEALRVIPTLTRGGSR